MDRRMESLWSSISRYWQKITYVGVDIWRIVDGKVVERKLIRNWLDSLRQIGLIEPMHAAFGREVFEYVHA
jgi:hypothetical protein